MADHAVREPDALPGDEVDRFVSSRGVEVVDHGLGVDADAAHGGRFVVCVVAVQVELSSHSRALGGEVAHCVAVHQSCCGWLVDDVFVDSDLDVFDARVVALEDPVEAGVSPVVVVFACAFFADLVPAFRGGHVVALEFGFVRPGAHADGVAAEFGVELAAGVPSDLVDALEDDEDVLTVHGLAAAVDCCAFEEKGSCIVDDCLGLFGGHLPTLEALGFEGGDEVEHERASEPGFEALWAVGDWVCGWRRCDIFC